MTEEEDIKKWWDENSSYYQKNKKISTKNAHYGPFSPDEGKLKLLGDVKNKKILELGCGAAQCSIAFAKKGARCTAIDISKEQIEIGKKLAKKNNVKIEFIVNSYQDLLGFKSKSFDIVFSAFGFQFSPDLKKLFKEIYRVLKDNGILVFSLDQPFFSIIDENKSYFDPIKNEMIERWKDGSLHKFIVYKRKFSEIINPLTESGFYIEKILEPIELKKETPWNKDYDINIIKRIGPTIIIKAKRI